MAKKRQKRNAFLGGFLIWPLVLGVFWIGLIVHLFLTGQKVSALYAGAYFAAYLVCAVIYIAVRRRRLMLDLVQYASEYYRAQEQELQELEVPFGMLDRKGHLLWGNEAFTRVIQETEDARKNITYVIPNLPYKEARDAEQDVEFLTELGERQYRMVMRRIVPGEEAGEAEVPEGAKLPPVNEPMIALYLHDETDLRRYMKENHEEKALIGLLYVDNYDEVIAGMEESRRSLLTALIDRRVNKYFSQYDCLVKRTETDRYVIVLKQKALEEIKENKFQILEEVKAVRAGENLAPTISIGVATGRKTFAESYEAARAVIDLALGRGGDQAVVREGMAIQYYGGKNVTQEKNTRVKARMKAHALQELIEGTEQVVIMGHKMGDADSLGAAVGVYRIAKELGKRAYIVLNERTRTIRPVLERLEESPEYGEEVFVRSERAVELMTPETLLVVVDTNRPNFTECPELLEMTSTVVNIDHHRRIGGETIDNAVLSYVEPFASSACEMVSEILQYTGDGIRLRPVEADALYGGIIIDTDHFLAKTGVRTFEAAAYLRRNGADMSRIRKAFRSDMDEVLFRAKAIGKTEVYRGAYAIGECNAEGMESPTVLGAQVANELLDITGIKASFVLTPFQERIYISARAIDEVNVQLVMERLGGGGNPSVAGAQLAGCTLEQAREKVKEVLDEMTKAGDI